MATTEVQVVHLYLSSPTEWIQALSIPRTDIERLTFRPLKWLRFAMFAVCGAKGDISATPGGEVVDYERVSCDDLADKYYYITADDYHLVDHQVFDDACTSSAATPRRARFRDEVSKRDVNCVITRYPDDWCDAAHIVPRRKGNPYITWVIHDRSSLYQPLPPSLQGDVDIDCVENGMLLRKDLHRGFGLGWIAFLKTPNFALEPNDVLWVDPNPTPGVEHSIPQNRTTLQYIKLPPGQYRVLPGDIEANWSDPPGILLDFMYGAAVVKHWQSPGLYDMLKERFDNDYAPVLAENPIPPASEDNEDEGGDDPNDPNYVPSRRKQQARKTFSSDAEAGMSDAMDTMFYLSMWAKGRTRQSVAAEQEKQRKEQERRSQEHSTEKVREWLGSDGSTRPS